jgi:hypothetical protein
VESSWHSYPSIYSLGHAAVKDIFTAPVRVEEKVDGSQFSAGRFGGVLRCRSKGATIDPNYPEAMFKEAVEAVSNLDLRDGWTYRFEYLQRPKHNVLQYSRIPKNHLVLFDINTGYEEYLPYDEMLAEGERLGLEVVPLLYFGIVESAEQLKSFLDRESFLGGVKVEGVVIKSTSLYGPDKKLLMAKFVREDFKEAHAIEWKQKKVSQGDIILRIADAYRTEARWMKAVQRLREAGKLEGSPRDIGLLIEEVRKDIEKECRDEIETILWKWAWPDVSRLVTRGLPEWYKNLLLERQFSGG